MTDTASVLGRLAGRTKVVAVFAGLTVFAWLPRGDPGVLASSGDGTIDPTGRGLQLLGGREAILLEQSDRSRRSARARALSLYRLLRFEAVERREGTPDTREHLGGRTVLLAALVLERDLGEARLLKAELDRVREERAALNVSKISPEGHPGVVEDPPPPLLRPVLGGVVAPFGVGRDGATGAWMFRAAASYAARAAEPVRSPADGRIVRVGSSLAGGIAVVLAHEPGGWTSVISGLGSVAVSTGDLVHRGDSLGSAEPVTFGGLAHPIRIEIWRGRTPIDPDSLLRAR